MSTCHPRSMSCLSSHTHCISSLPPSRMSCPARRLFAPACSFHGASSMAVQPICSQDPSAVGLPGGESHPANAFKLVLASDVLCCCGDRLCVRVARGSLTGGRCRIPIAQRIARAGNTQILPKGKLLLHCQAECGICCNALHSNEASAWLCCMQPHAGSRHVGV